MSQFVYAKLNAHIFIHLQKKDFKGIAKNMKVPHDCPYLSTVK